MHYICLQILFALPSSIFIIKPLISTTATHLLPPPPEYCKFWFPISHLCPPDCLVSTWQRRWSLYNLNSIVTLFCWKPWVNAKDFTMNKMIPHNLNPHHLLTSTSTTSLPLLLCWPSHWTLRLPGTFLLGPLYLLFPVPEMLLSAWNDILDVWMAYSCPLILASNIFLMRSN